MKKNINTEIQILINRYNNGEFNDVLKKISLLVKDFPKNDFLWNLSGLSFQKIGNIRDSITSFQNAIQANTKNYAAHNNLALSLKYSKDYREAERILKLGGALLSP